MVALSAGADVTAAGMSAYCCPHNVQHCKLQSVVARPSRLLARTHHHGPAMEATKEYQESTTIRLEWTVGNLKNLFDGRCV